MESPSVSSSSTMVGIHHIRDVNVLQRLRYEYFYSGLDNEYFQGDEFMDCLVHIGVNIPIKRVDFIMIRALISSQIGSPRRFSNIFIAKERNRLNLYRNRKRAEVSHPSDSSMKIQCGDAVIVYSRVRKVLGKGRVLSSGPLQSEGRAFLITFERHLLFQDEWVNDYNICLAKNSIPSLVDMSTAQAVLEAAIRSFSERAKEMIVNVIERQEYSTQYAEESLDMIVRCISFALWMKSSNSEEHKELLRPRLFSHCRLLAECATNYITGNVNIKGEEEVQLKDALTDVMKLL